MIKQLLLIAALVPTASTAHEWDQHQWLSRFLDNHMTIGKCQKLAEADIASWRATCMPKLDTMVIHKNRYFTQYTAEKLRHPVDDDLTFIADHFADEDEDYIWGIYLNITRRHDFSAALLRQYVIKGLTANSTKEGKTEHGVKRGTSAIYK